MSQVTKKALEASLKKLLLEKPLNKITINDIAEECGINRMTFYYHFRDIYDLIEWSCEEAASRLLDGKKNYATWQQGYLQIFESIKENKAFVMNVYNSVSREQIERFLYKVTYGLLIDVVEEEAAGLNSRQSDKEFVAEIYKYALVGIVLDWIRKDMPDSPEEIVSRLAIAIKGNIRGALERLRDSSI